MEEGGTSSFLHENVWACDQTRAICENTPSFRHYLFKMEPDDSGFPQVARIRGYLWNVRRGYASLRFDVGDVLDFVKQHMSNPDFTVSL